MYRIYWRYVVKAGQVSRFEQTYGPDGEWVRFFRAGEGYVGTQLYREIGTERRYVTIDEWRTGQQYDDFRREHLREYQAIDRRCDELTDTEEPLGAHVS